jgi:hypothetical protein
MMGIRNTPEQQRAYSVAKCVRDAAAGYIRKEIHVHRDDWPKVKQLVADLDRRREQREQLNGESQKPAL